MSIVPKSRFALRGDCLDDFSGKGEAMGTPEVLIIIPAYNEEKNIRQVLKEIRNFNYDVDIIVINDASQDKTRSVVEANGERVINHLYNLGYGGALQTGFKFALDKGYKYVIQFDGDGQHDPADIQSIINELESGDCDIVIGSRFLDSNSFKLSLVKRFAVKIFRFIIRISTGVKITDPTSGLQGLNRKTYAFYSRMGNFPDDFPDADTLIHMLKNSYRVKEIPAHMKHRKYGQSMHSGLKGFYYILKMIVSISVVLLRSNFTTNKVLKG